MLKSQLIALFAVTTFAACTTAPPPASHAQPAQPSQTAHDQPLNSTPVGEQRLTLRGDANFETDSATLTASAVSELDRLIEGMRNTTIDAIRISGYTDSAGSGAHNQELSERRALSVAQYLAAHGLKAHRLVQVRGFGKANPVASNTSAEGREQNRRVEVVLEVKKVGSL